MSADISHSFGRAHDRTRRHRHPRFLLVRLAGIVDSSVVTQEHAQELDSSAGSCIRNAC